MDLAAEGEHATDDGAENVDREELQETRNKINEAISNTNPGKVLQWLFCNRPFYSRVLSGLVLDWKRGWG